MFDISLVDIINAFGLIIAYYFGKWYQRREYQKWIKKIEYSYTCNPCGFTAKTDNKKFLDDVIIDHRNRWHNA